MFSQALPEFLAIGMSVEQFYDGPCWLAGAFRKAYRRKREQANFDAYLQGAYVYEAILRCRQYYNPFVKEPKPDPWLDKPYELGGSDRRTNMGGDGKHAEKGATAAGVAFFRGYAAKHNAKMAEKARGGSEEH